MGVLTWNQLTMQLFVILSTLAAVLAAPAPQDEDIPAAVPYVHEDIAAEAYVHIEPENTVEEIAAEAYVHEEPVPALAPVFTYAAYPYATHAYTIPVAAAPV